MKIEYHNLYTHYVLVTLNRVPLILEKFREKSGLCYSSRKPEDL